MTPLPIRYAQYLYDKSYREGAPGGWQLHIGDETLLATDRRLPSFERRESLGEADNATEDELAEAAGVLATAEVARL